MIKFEIIYIFFMWKNTPGNDQKLDYKRLFRVFKIVRYLGMET